MTRPTIIALVVALLLWTPPALAALPGDADCDAVIDHDDVAVLAQSLFGELLCGDADANGDGIASAADLPSLITTLAGDGAVGPIVTFFGVAASGGDVTTPVGTTGNHLPVYWRPAGIGFKLVIEAAIGASGAAVAQVTEPSSGRPDIQIESSQTLGDGSFDRCPGTVSGIDPAYFGPGEEVDEALRAFACGARISTTRATACTLDGLGNPNWVDTTSQLQFCLQIQSLRRFPEGQTRLIVRLRDVDGNLGPAGRMVVVVGATPPATSTATPVRSPTATRTRTATGLTATATGSPTRTQTLLPTGRPSSTPTRTTSPPAPTSTPTSTRTPSPTSSVQVSPSTPTRTNTRSPTLTTTPAGATATPSRTPTVGATFSRTATPTRSGTPTASRTPTSSQTSTRSVAPTFTPKPSPTPQLTSTPTRTRTPTLTASPTPQPQPGDGPVVTFFGIANANDSVATPTGETPNGVPVYERLLGTSMRLVVEGRPGKSSRPVGTSVFDYDPADPLVRPDLQIQVNRTLGNGSTEVCDNTLPNIGGIPAIDPPSFAFTDPISAALSDLGCRFVDGQGVPGARGPSEACTVFSDGNFRFVCSTSDSPSCTHGQSTVQFCSDYVLAAFAFPQGDTLVTVQLRDRDGNTGPPVQIIVRVL